MSTTATHQCGAPGCKRRIPLAQFLCPRHWYQVPAIERQAIWAAYRNYTANPSEENLDVLRRVQQAGVGAMKP